MDIRKLAEELNAEAAAVRRGIDALWPADVPRCPHRHATLVQQQVEDDWWVTWQCDDCGMPDASRPVTAEDLDRGHELPWFNREFALREIDRLIARHQATAAFFGKAAQR